MTRRPDFEKKDNLSLEDFSLKCSETLDKSVDTYQSINELNSIASAVCGKDSGEISCALNEMESVMVHIASASVDGDIEKTREALESRGLKSVF